MLARSPTKWTHSSWQHFGTIDKLHQPRKTSQTLLFWLKAKFRTANFHYFRTLLLTETCKHLAVAPQILGCFTGPAPLTRTLRHLQINLDARDSVEAELARALAAKKDDFQSRRKLKLLRICRSRDSHDPPRHRGSKILYGALGHRGLRGTRSEQQFSCSSVYLTCLTGAWPSRLFRWLSSGPSTLFGACLCCPGCGERHTNLLPRSTSFWTMQRYPYM